MKNILSIVVLMLVCQLFKPNTSIAQAENRVDILAREDGRVFLFHPNIIPLSHGFHVYRKLDDGEWIQLTSNPVMPVQNGFQLQQRLGLNYRLLTNALPGRDPQSVFLILRSGTPEALLTALAMPELSKALGFSWVDETKPEAQQVSYRLELVNDLGSPEGTVFEGSGSLQPIRPLPVTEISAEHSGTNIKLTWSYPATNSPRTERVMQFRPRYRISGDTQIRDVPDRFILRTTENNTFEYSFDVPEIGRDYEFWIEARDYSGQQSVNNTIVRKSLVDNEPPPRLNGVRGKAIDDVHAQVNWPVSTALNAVGYHVYRTTSDDQDFDQITTEPLELLQTTFIDTSTVPGVQYRYGVKVLGSNMLLSEMSNVANVSILDNERPQPVSGLRASLNRESGLITVTWETPEQSIDRIVYRVMRRQIRPAAANTFAVVSDVRDLGNSITDSGSADFGFTEGVTYQYAVAPFRSNGISGDTLFAEIRIPVVTPPDAPLNVVAELRNNQEIHIFWPAASSPAVTSYRLYRVEVGAENPTLIQEAGREVRSYRDEGLPLNSSWMYSVSSVDSVGNESQPMASEKVLVRRMNPPLAAYNVQAVQTDEGVLLAWQIREDESLIEKFNIYTSEIATGEFVFVGYVESGQLRYLHSEGKGGDWFKVFPVNKYGIETRQARATQARSK